MAIRRRLTTALSTLVTFFAFIALSVPLAAQTHPNLSGTWILDPAKSVVDGPMQAPSAGTYVVQHIGDSIAVDQKFTADQGEQDLKKVWKVDGYAWSNTISYGGVELVLKTTLSWKGEVLTMHTVTDFQGNPVEQNETWTLSPDGKTLTIATTTNANGDYYSSVTVVLNKSR